MKPNLLGWAFFLLYTISSSLCCSYLHSVNIAICINQQQVNRSVYCNKLIVSTIQQQLLFKKTPQNCSLYFFFKPWVRNVIPCQWDLWDTLMYHSSFCRFPPFVKVLTLSTSACWKCNKEKKKMIIIIFINFFILHYTGKKPTETDPVWSCSQDKSNFLKKNKTTKPNNNNKKQD